MSQRPEVGLDEDVPRKGRTGCARLGFIFLLAAFGVIVTGLLAHLLNRVDSDEYAVMERYVTPILASAEFTVTESQRGDSFPCWWWCEDYVLDVDLRVEFTVGGVDSHADLCGTLRDELVAGIGRAPDRDEELRGPRCLLTWSGIQVGGRDLSISTTSRSWPDTTVVMRITNLSTQRAFLPY